MRNNTSKIWLMLRLEHCYNSFTQPGSPDVSRWYLELRAWDWRLKPPSRMAHGSAASSPATSFKPDLLHRSLVRSLKLILAVEEAERLPKQNVRLYAMEVTWNAFSDTIQAGINSAKKTLKKHFVLLYSSISTKTACKNVLNFFFGRNIDAGTLLLKFVNKFVRRAIIFFRLLHYVASSAFQ